MPLLFINGKFFDNGNEVPLQFGNKEQIKLIEAVKQLQHHGAVANLVFDDTHKGVCGISLKCVCGHRLFYGWDTPDEANDIAGRIIQCGGCNFNYRVYHDEYGFFFFKLV